MAVKVYRFQKDSHSFEAKLPSGFASLTGFTAMQIKFTKPDNTVITKSLTGSNVDTTTGFIKFNVDIGLLDQEGIYDYQVINLTSSQNEIGKILQFSVYKNLF